MPQSKRNRILPTSRVTAKKTSESKKALFSKIQSAASTHPYIYVFSVADMRNNAIKDLRNTLPTSRIMMGKTRIMSLALGTTVETAAEPGLENLSGYLKGEVGLLFTDLIEKEIREVLEGARRPDYARSGNRARSTFVIPRGEELYTSYGVEGGEEDSIPMAQEPLLRKLGVPTKIVKGRVFLEEGVVGDVGDEKGFVLCREGEILDSRQTTLLKIFGVRMAEFRVRLLAVWEKEREGIRELDAGEEVMDVNDA